MIGKVLFALYCLAGAIGAHADVTINYSAFKHSSGDHWVKVTAYCEGLQLHEWASGAPLDMDDCPKTLSGSVAATFPGSSGTYDIVLGIRAMDYGGGKWFLSVGGTQVGSGNSPKIPCADPCSKKCGGKCTELSVKSGVRVAKGEKIVFGGSTAWPCGCGGVRGGAYPTFKYVLFKGGATSVVPSAPLADVQPVAVYTSRNRVALQVNLAEPYIIRLVDIHGAAVETFAGRASGQHVADGLSTGSYIVEARTSAQRHTVLCLVR